MNALTALLAFADKHAEGLAILFILTLVAIIFMRIAK